MEATASRSGGRKLWWGRIQGMIQGMYFTVFTYGHTLCLSVVYYNYCFVCTRSVSEADSVVKTEEGGRVRKCGSLYQIRTRSVPD